MKSILVTIKNQTIAAGICLFILTSCDSENNLAEKESTPRPLHAPVEDHEHNENTALELNQGERWPVDGPMLVYLRGMESEINQASDTSSSGMKKLAGSLQKNLDLLTSNCTMEGKAHDELHKWLIPFISLVDRFSEGDESENRMRLDSLRESFNTFNKFFE